VRSSITARQLNPAAGAAYWKNATGWRMNTSLGQPRGVLHPRLPQGEFEHTRRAPSLQLAVLVEHYWYVSWDLRGLPGQLQETLPHPNVHYVVEAGRTAIYGVHSARYVRTLEGQGRAFGIKFKAGAFRSFYGKPVSGLKDRSLDPAGIFGASATRFESEVSATFDVDAMASAAERFLLAHIPATTQEAVMVGELVAKIATDRSLTSVEALVALSNLGKRQLQRLFNEYVGVSPKWVINRYRLHEAIAQLQSGHPVAWAELALELGYFDQSHFIHDFRRLLGRTPAEYALAVKAGT
jgi:AraC-like DNA-binding protein